LTTSKKHTVRDTVLIIVSSLLIGHLLFWLLPNVFETWNSQAFDQMFILRYKYFPSRNPYNGQVVHVDETDSTVYALTETGSYLTRRQYAEVARTLGLMKAGAQIWDYVFRALEDSASDKYFYESNQIAGNAYYGFAIGMGEKPPTQRPLRPESHWKYLSETKWFVKIDGDTSKMYFGGVPIMTYPELAASARGIGYLDIRIDPDGVYRRAPLLVRYEDGFYPSFPFHAICDYLKVTPENVIISPGKHVILKNAQLPNQQPHDIVIPVDEKCNIIVNYIGPWNAMQHTNFARIYDLSFDSDARENEGTVEYQGKIVVVSVAATGAADVAPVPTDNDFPLSGIHANIVHTILTENFLVEWKGIKMLAIEAIILLIVYGMSSYFQSKGLAISAVVLLVGYILLVLIMFLYGNVIINIVRPVFMIILSVFGVVGYRYFNEEKEKEALRQSFEAYLPPTIVKRMLANPESIFAGQKKELTILFSDIKSFTTYSSTMTPDQIQNMLNEYFEAMVDIVFKYEGTVDKYIGDGLMVFFGAPEPQSDHAIRCVRAAIEMQKKCRELKAKWSATGLFPLRIRIGVNTGPVVVGNMGSARKLSYTVLGSDVNLANRLESNAPVEGIMISRRTYELVKDTIPALPHEPVLVKGLDTPIEVYTVPVDDSPAPTA